MPCYYCVARRQASLTTVKAVRQASWLLYLWICLLCFHMYPQVISPHKEIGADGAALQSLACVDAQMPLEMAATRKSLRARGAQTWPLA